MAALSGCGQKGPLFLPTDPSAQGHATLPESLGLSMTKKPDAAAPTKANTDEAKPVPSNEESEDVLPETGKP